MLTQSTIAILIVVVTIILYATEKLPLSVTTILAMLAMVLTGILTPAQAFAGFSSTVTLLLIGITILGEAFITSGLADKMGGVLMRLTHMPRNIFVALVFLFSSALSAVLNGLAVMAILIPILNTISQAKPELSKKYTYLPLAFGSVLGGNITLIGSTSMINASNLLDQATGQSIGFFSPTLVSLPMVFVVFIFYILIGQKLQEKFLNFEETGKTIDIKVDKSEASNSKSILVVIIMTLCIIGFITASNLAVVALLGGMAVIVLKCINSKRAYSSISWETLFVVAGSIGFAKGVEVSGAGQVIADFMINLFGSLAQSPFGLCVIMLVLTTIMSNFMSNNAAVTLMIPIGVTLAASLGHDPLPLAVAIGTAANLSLATPICTATVTMTTVVGYRFKDYFIIGGIVNLIALVVVALSFLVVYY